ncbi:hypothetical protein PVAND_015926 [Polypedilum vanderplanki]|uniref:UBC core domain-containing protein n=1 Tax=Polypedilum vanderplanki TaxID=319348 RepID=A0A9J6BEC3_POLVA|nr:hypothetical protein PVAND_015926 [Polypedilum vanderplanki]
MPIDANSSDEIIDEVLCTTKTEYRILLELKLISTEFNTGSIYIIPSKSNSLLWNGIYFIRSGPYKDAILRFKIQLETNYPNQKTPPELKLEFPIEHPLISPDTQIFDSSHAFPTWNESEHLYSFLKYFKYAMENFDFCVNLPIEKIINIEIAELYKKDQKEFKEKAKEMIVKSVNQIFIPTGDENIFSYDRNSIEEDEEIHQSILENMKTVADNLPESFSFLFDNRNRSLH